jgi:hypothetical protein
MLDLGVGKPPFLGLARLGLALTPLLSGCH